MEFMGITFTFIGELLIGYTAIAVHYRFRKEHKVDELLFSVMKREHVFGILGIFFLIVGYISRLVIWF